MPVWRLEIGWCSLLPLWLLLHVNLDFSLSNKHFRRHCYGIQTNYVIMACYNAITELDPSDCLFKKQWEWEEVVRFHTPGWETWAGPKAAWLTAVQRLSKSAVHGEPETTNQIRRQPAHQTVTTNRGGAREDPGIAVVHPTWDYGMITQEKKGKVSHERKKLKVVMHGRKEGDSMLLLIGSSRFCDRRLHLISCRLKSSGADCVYFKVGFIRLTLQPWSAEEI